jgi:hypothetical protein
MIWKYVGQIACNINSMVLLLTGFTITTASRILFSVTETQYVRHGLQAVTHNSYQ